jgi:hypothetical protein
MNTKRAYLYVRYPPTQSAPPEGNCVTGNIEKINEISRSKYQSVGIGRGQVEVLSAVVTEREMELQNVFGYGTVVTLERSRNESVRVVYAPVVLLLFLFLYLLLLFFFLFLIYGNFFDTLVSLRHLLSSLIESNLVVMVFRAFQGNSNAGESHD